MPKSAVKIFIVACEASGDNIGAKLIKAFNQLPKKPIPIFQGIGGLKMEAQGFKSIFPMQDLSIMGFTEIIPKIPLVFKRMNEAIEVIKSFKPDVIITIDSYGFNSRLIKKVRALPDLQCKIYHYVSPTVWAYKPKRAEIIKQLYDEILLLLPFEKPYYDAINFPATFVGHPIVEDYEFMQNKLQLKKSLGFSNKQTLCALMPGSRVGELEKHASVFRQTIQNIRAQRGDGIKFFIPTLPHLKEKIINIFAHLDVIITDDANYKNSLFKACDIALIKSGTSSVEMMLHNIPHVVGYKISWLSYWFIKMQVKVKFISLVNIISDREGVPEFIQGNFNADKITAALLQLIASADARLAQTECFAQVLNLFGLNDVKTPSQKAVVRIMLEVDKS